MAIFCFIYIAPLTTNAGKLGCFIPELTGRFLPSIGFINKDNHYFGDNAVCVGRNPRSGPIPDYLKKPPYDLKGFIFGKNGNNVNLTKARLINFSPTNPASPFKVKIKRISIVPDQSFNYLSEIKEVKNIFETIQSSNIFYTTRSCDENWYGAEKCVYTSTNITYILTAYGNIYRSVQSGSYTVREGGYWGDSHDYGYNMGGVNTQLVYSPDYPSVDLKINNIDEDPLLMIAPNTDTALGWTSNEVVDCKASGDWSGDKKISGEEKLGKLPRGKENPGQGKVYNFIISCLSEDGEKVSDKVSAKILQYPACQFYAKPSPIVLPEISVLNWACEYTDKALISPKIGEINPISGNIEVRPAETTIFSLDAFGLDGSKFLRTTVEVKRPEQPGGFNFWLKEVAP